MKRNFAFGTHSARSASYIPVTITPGPGRYDSELIADYETQDKRFYLEIKQGVIKRKV